MLEELEKLLDFIQKEYIELNQKWEATEYYSKINLKDNLVCNLLEDKLILNMIVSYREFINENNIQLLMDFKQFNTDNAKINMRVKTKNSIEYKIKNYTLYHAEGKVPINKCFNDLFGMRIIFNKDITYSQILSLTNKEKYKKLKCIDSSKGEYKATHIYFKKDKYSFPWELQVWNKKDEENNIISHEKYKQDYVKWENENRGENE